ncbi:MAG TPA: Ig-like domain-containing protein [Candidatus Binatia bacterium]|nr:Ig-like domain-containing protein [Candidatus Binatia bacterium]
MRRSHIAVRNVFAVLIMLLAGCFARSVRAQDSPRATAPTVTPTCGPSVSSSTSAPSCTAHAPANIVRYVPTRKGSGKKSDEPFSVNLVYYGGPVVSNAQVVVVFWGNQVDSTLQSGIGGFYQAILPSNYAHIVGEYDTIPPIVSSSPQVIGQGTFVGAYTISPDWCPVEEVCTVTDQEVQIDLNEAIGNGVLPAPVLDAGGNVNTIYAVYFPPEVTINYNGILSCQQFCAYHSSVKEPSGQLFYDIVPDMSTFSACAGFCGTESTPFQMETAISSQILADTQTDPYLSQSSGFAPPLAWIGTLGEVGDTCFLEENSLAQIDGYTVQTLFSNHSEACISAVPDFLITAPSSATVGNSFSITVTAQNSDGSTETGYTGTVIFISTDPLAVLPANYTFTSADQGVHNFSVILNTTGSQLVSAIDSAYGGQSGTATVAVTQVTHFGVSAPSSSQAGVPFNVTVTALDQNNQTVTSYTGTVHFSSSDSAATLPSDSALASGVGTFSVTLRTLGSQTVSVVDTAHNNISGSASVLDTPGPAVRFTVAAPSPDTAGTPFNITVTAFDAFNNVATGYSGLVHFSSSDLAAVLPPNSPLSAGVGTFPVTLNTAGNQSVTATDSVNSSITGSVSVSVLLSGQQTTSTTLTSSLNPSTYGVDVTFTAEVVASTGTPQGVVTFQAGSQLLGRVTLLAGFASLTTAYLRPGTPQITASYNGNTHFVGSSASLIQTQNKALTGTDVISSANPSTFGQSVTFTVTVDSVGGVPAGNVVFSDGGSMLATVALTNGTAAYQTSALTSGTHHIKVAYKGNADFEGSVAALTQLVN